jgi:hypothetical protein
MPDEERGQIEWGILKWPTINKLQKYFWVIFNLKSSICVYGESAKQRKKPDQNKTF